MYKETVVKKTVNIVGKTQPKERKKWFGAECEEATNKKNIAYMKTLNERAAIRTKEEYRLLKRIDKITHR